jgi:hypothetical protein
MINHKVASIFNEGYVIRVHGGGGGGSVRGQHHVSVALLPGL